MKKKRMPIVEITFDDHCMYSRGAGDVVKCRVFGVLFHQTKTTYHVAAWIAGDELDDNADTYAIRRHPGVKVRRLGKF